MAKPIRKYVKGAVSLAVFEKENEDSSTNEFYSLQRSRRIGNAWKNESILLNPEQLSGVMEVVRMALSEVEEESSSSASNSNTYPRQSSSRENASWPSAHAKLNDNQTCLIDKNAEAELRNEILQEEIGREKMLLKNEPQAIKVYDWGMVTSENYKGEVETKHDFLVVSDNSIVGIGMGDINEAIADVRKELNDNGYQNLIVQRIPMKEGECVGNLVG